MYRTNQNEQIVQTRLLSVARPVDPPAAAKHAEALKNISNYYANFNDDVRSAVRSIKCTVPAKALSHINPRPHCVCTPHTQHIIMFQTDYSQNHPTTRQCSLYVSASPPIRYCVEFEVVKTAKSCHKIAPYNQLIEGKCFSGCWIINNQLLCSCVFNF